MHLAEGVTPESRRRALDRLGWNLWRRPVVGVHGVSLEEDDFARLAALVWCPASNLFLFGSTAKAAVAARRTTLLFGSDATISAPGTLWDHLRYARGSVREEIIFESLTTAADRFWHLDRPADFVVARRHFANRWDAFFATTPADLLAIVRDNQTMLLDHDLAPSCPPGFAALGRKYVRMDLPPLLEGLSAHIDPAKLVARFTGPSTSDTRAE
jgi:hypothetical protein